MLGRHSNLTPRSYKLQQPTMSSSHRSSSHRSPSQRSSHSPSFTTARLPRETQSPSTSHHQVTPPVRTLTPSSHSSLQRNSTRSAHTNHLNSTRMTSPRHNLFSTQDDDSINSTDSNDHEMMLITPCTDFTKHGVWLKKQFPDIISPSGGFFVHSQLKIRSQNDIDSFMEFSQDDWINFLPRSYHI